MTDLERLRQQCRIDFPLIWSHKILERKVRTLPPFGVGIVVGDKHQDREPEVFGPATARSERVTSDSATSAIR